MVEAESRRPAHAPPPEGHFGGLSLLLEVVEDGAQVVALLPSQSDPLALGVAAAAEVESEEIDSVGEDLGCQRVTFVFVSRVPVHIDHAWSLRSLLQVRLREVAAVQALAFGVSDHEVVLDALETSENVGEGDTGIVRVRVARRSDDQA